MVAVLMDGAREGQRWPRPSEAIDLLRYVAPSRLRQGPPPGSFARRHPRGVITIRVLVGLWLVVVTIVLCQYTLRALLLLLVVAAHVYLAARTAVFTEPGAGEPPSASSAGG